MNTSNLPTVSPDVIKAFGKKRYALVQKAVAKILDYQDWQPILGPNAEDILTSGMSFTAETMEAIMAMSSPAIIDQQVSWGKDYLTGVGITADMVLKNMEILAEVTAETFPENTYPGLVNWMQIMIEKQRKALEKA